MDKTRKRTRRSGEAQRKTLANQPAPAAGRSWFPELSLLDLGIGLALILAIFAIYSQVTNFDFVGLDDNVYVFDNAHVKAGLTLQNVKWALTAVVCANWTPVTILSHLLDVQFFHMDSGMHHLVNVVFHALAALLLFAALKRATGARWASAFVAFMFAVHPLHVGSVAWIAERKDVLSAVFWFLGLYAYVRYAERPGVGRYLAVTGAFCLGLMSKPMLVTFPFTLLLFDVWPLRRAVWPKILWEKVPLFALSAADCLVTYLVQQSNGAVMGVPPAVRFENALTSYVKYIAQMFWPTRLAIFYPFAKSIEVWQAVLAAAVILGLSALAVSAWRSRPYLAVGWFWYLGTLIPVIGLVQVGGQAHADRYTYVPMIGLSMILAWGAADVARRWPGTNIAFGTAAAVSCLFWMALASKEAAYWQNSETIFERAIAVTEGNWAAEYGLAYYLAPKPRRRADVIAHYEAAVRIRPDYADAQRNLGLLLLTSRGRQAEALAHLEAAQRLDPRPDLEPIIAGLRGEKR